MELIDRTTGKPVQVPDDQAQAAFQSGQYGVVAGSRIPVKLADGRVGTVKAEDLHQTLTAGGALASGQEWQQAQAAKAAAAQEEKYGAGLGSLQQLQNLSSTAAEGTLRGLTLGLSDPITLKVAEAIGGPAAREQIRKDMLARQETNPITAMGTELGGALAPMVIPGGQAGGAAKAVASAGKLVEAAELARGAGTAVELAEAAKTAGTAAKAAGTAAEVARGATAAESAVKGATALPRALDAAGTLAEGIGKQAAKALVGEGSTSVLARMVEKGLAQGARGAVEGALYGAGGEVSNATLHDEAITGEKLAAAMSHGAMMGGLIGGGLGAGSEALSTGVRGALKVVSPTAKRIAEEQAVKALQYGGLSPTKLTRRLEDLPGGAAAAGRMLIDDGLVKAGDTVEHVAPRLEQAVGDSGGKLTDILRAAGKELPQPKIGDIIADYSAEISSRFGKHLDAPTLNYIDSRVTPQLLEKFPEGTASLEALRDFRRTIDDHISWNPSAPGAKSNPTQEALKVVRAKLEGAIEKTLDEGGQKLEGATLDHYLAEKLKFRRLTTLNDMAQDSLARVKKNQSVSVSEKMLAGMGIMHGLASGNPLSALGGLASSAAHHALQARGNSTAAVLLDKIAELGALSRTVNAVDERASVAMDRFLEGKPAEVKPIKFASKAERDARFTAAEKRIKLASDDPVGHASAVQSSLGAVAQHAPKAAAAAAMAASRGTTYLAARLPKRPAPNSIQPQFDKREPSSQEKEQFLRSVRAVDDPLSIVDDMSHGRLTREGVDAVRNVYPELFGQIQQMALRKATDATKPMKYDQKLQLGILLGVPTDATLRPEFVKRMQDTYQGQEQSPGDKPHGAVKRPLEGMNKAVGLGQRRSD